MAQPIAVSKSVRGVLEIEEGLGGHPGLFYEFQNTTKVLLTAMGCAMIRSSPRKSEKRRLCFPLADCVFVCGGRVRAREYQRNCSRSPPHAPGQGSLVHASIEEFKTTFQRFSVIRVRFTKSRSRLRFVW